MAERKDVVFRRIRGRIVPIKITKRQKEGAQGAGLVAVGVAGALKLGRISGFTQKKSADARQLAFRFGKGKAGISAIEGLVPGQRSFFRSRKLSALSKNLASFGRIGAAASIGLGVEKLISATGAESKGLVPEFAGEAAGVSAAALVAAGAEKGFKGTKLRKQAVSTVKKHGASGFKAAAKFVIRSKFKLRF